MSNKAKRATIKIAGIEVEVFQLPDGGYVMSQSQVAEAVGIQEIGFRRFLKEKSLESLPNKSLGFDKISIPGTGRQINVIPVRTASLFWVHQNTKGNVKAQALVYACVEEALERRCDAAFQQVKSEQEYEEKTEQNAKNAPDWLKSRNFCKDAHILFTRTCQAFDFRAAKIHDMITIAVCGKRARELRQLKVIEGNPKIGLNHIEDAEMLVKIAKVKFEFSRYETGTPKQRIKRALESINN